MVYKILSSDLTIFDASTTHLITPSADGLYSLIFSSIELTNGIIEQINDSNLDSIVTSAEWLQPCV